MEDAIWVLCMIEAFKIFSLVMIWWKIDGYEEGKREGEYFGYTLGQMDEMRRQDLRKGVTYYGHPTKMKGE